MWTRLLIFFHNLNYLIQRKVLIFSLAGQSELLRLCHLLQGLRKNGFQTFVCVLVKTKLLRRILSPLRMLDICFSLFQLMPLIKFSFNSMHVLTILKKIQLNCIQRFRRTEKNCAKDHRLDLVVTYSFIYIPCIFITISKKDA